MTNEGELHIIGCGGHARSVADVALTSGFASITFIDPMARPGETIFGFPVVSDSEFEARRLTRYAYIVALGDNGDRAAAFTRHRQLSGIPARSVIAPDARIGRDAMIGAGVFIGASAHVGPSARVGDDSIINTRAIVEHEAVIGDHTHVAVNAILLGRSSVGDRVLLGAGAIVLDGVSIASDCVIGAGAVVAASIGAPGIYAGVPARQLGTRQ